MWIQFDSYEDFKDIMDKCLKYEALFVNGVDNWIEYYDSIDNYAMHLLDDKHGYDDWDAAVESIASLYPRKE